MPWHLLRFGRACSRLPGSGAHGFRAFPVLTGRSEASLPALLPKFTQLPKASAAAVANGPGFPARGVLGACSLLSTGVAVVAWEVAFVAWEVAFVAFVLKDSDRGCCLPPPQELRLYQVFGSKHPLRPGCIGRQGAPSAKAAVGVER